MSPVIANRHHFPHHLALFGIEDADIYQRIDLFEQDWLTRKSRRLDTVLFPA